MNDIEVIRQIFDNICQNYGPELIDTSVLSVVKNRFPSDPLWGLFCALVNFQVKISSILIPELNGLAETIELNVGNKFQDFISLSSDDQIQLLSTFQWENNAGNHKGWSHRLIKIPHILCFFKKLKILLKQNISLENFFKVAYNQSHQPPRISGMIRYFYEELGRIKCKNECTNPQCPDNNPFFLDPFGNATFKCLNLFLRWYIRCDPPDMGKWQFIEQSELLMPVDTGIGRVLYRIGKLPNDKPNWSNVLFASQFFKELNPSDPIRYDFAISRLGILRLCNATREQSKCELCQLKPICKSKINPNDYIDTEIFNPKVKANVKGEYLELKFLEYITNQGYIPDYHLRQFRLTAGQAEKYIKKGFLRQGSFVELDLIATRKKATESKLTKINLDVAVAECKYRNNPPRKSDIEFFAYKTEDFAGFLQQYYSQFLRISDLEFHKYFLSIYGGWTPSVESICQDAKITLLDIPTFNNLLKEKGLRQVAVIF